jgi:hypothetical protein
MHFLFSSFFFFFCFENLAIYDIMWTNTVEPGMPLINAWRLRIAWWVAKATITQDMECLLLFHCNNGCTNAPECYVIRALCLVITVTVIS